MATVRRTWSDGTSAFPSYFHAGVVLLVLLHPLARGSWDLWSQTLVRFAWLALLIPAGAMALAQPRRLDAAWPRFRSAAAPAGLWVAGSFLSAALSRFPHSADRGFLNDLTAAAFFLAPACAGAEWRRRLSLALAGSGALAAAVAVAARRISPDGALSGALVNPNVLAALLVLTAPLAVGQALQAPSGPRRLLWAALAAGQAACLAATSSFLAYLVVMAQAAFLIRAQVPGRRRFWAAAVAAAALAGAVWFAGDWSRFLTWDPDRLSWWKTAGRMWLNHVFIGVGPGAFGEALPGFSGSEAGLKSLYAHNFVLEWLAERGVLWLAAVAVAAKTLSWRGKADAADPAVVAAAGFAAYNLAHIGFSFPATYWSFCVLAGVIAGERFADRAPRRVPDAAKTGSIGAVLLLALFAGWASHRLFSADRHLARARHLAATAPEEAGREVELGLARNPREPELYSLRAALRGMEGRWEAALQDSERSVYLSPYTPRFQQEAGLIRKRLSGPDPEGAP